MERRFSQLLLGRYSGARADLRACAAEPARAVAAVLLRVQAVLALCLTLRVR